MVLLLAGCSHTGKTALAQKLLEKYQYPYLSIDHLKMGLIRSGQTTLTPQDDAELQEYIWPIVREIAKTAIENKQNLIIEGCYIPFDWAHDFTDTDQKEIQYCCLIMTEHYIRTHISDIRRYANVIEQRLDDSDLNIDALIAENAYHFAMCQKYNCRYILINDSYPTEIDL